MASMKAKLWGKSSKELRPGERALPLHLAPVIIVAAPSQGPSALAKAAAAAAIAAW